jgi:molecular chaperone DnaJ
MYDQQGFYSDSGFAAGGHEQNQGPGMGFGGFDFSDYFSQAQGAGARSARGARPAAEAGGGFKDLFSQFFGKGNHGEEAPTAERGTDLEYALGIDFWQAIRGTQIRLNISHQEVCETCHGAKSAPGGSSVTLSAVRGDGERDADGGVDEIQFDLSALLGSGQAAERLSDVSWGRACFAERVGRGEDSARGAERVAIAGGRKRQRGHDGDGGG